jgi:hypothetical protein
MFQEVRHMPKYVCNFPYVSVLDACFCATFDVVWAGYFGGDEPSVSSDTIKTGENHILHIAQHA